MIRIISICLQKKQKRKIDIYQMTEAQVTGLHKCDDCPQCLEFDQGQFLFVLTQFVSLWLVQTLPSWPPIGWRVTSVCPHCVTPGGAILNKIMTGLAWLGLVTLGFYLQFHSPHCLGPPAPGTRTSGDISSLIHIHFHCFWWCLVCYDGVWLFSMFALPAHLISASLFPVTFGSHNSLMSLVNLNPRFRWKVQY